MFIPSVRRELPKDLRKTKSRDLSIPIMFNLLLHLANEKKLEIQPLGDGDLDIIPLGEEDDIGKQNHSDIHRKKRNKKITDYVKNSTTKSSKTPSPPLIENNKA